MSDKDDKIVNIASHPGYEQSINYGLAIKDLTSEELVTALRNLTIKEYGNMMCEEDEENKDE